jgi:hypothetical protein
MGTELPNIAEEATDGKGGHPTSNSLTISYVGAAAFVSFLVLAVYVFALVQLVPPGDAWLASEISFRGHFGVEQALPGVSYTELLESSGVISFVGLFLFSYGRTESLSFVRRALVSLSLPLKVFGLVIASIVYTETHLLWGELWYGVRFLANNPQGFPWGNERVASNLCFLHGSDYIPAYGSYCWFLNYDELLFISLGMVILGFLISRSRSIKGIEASQN